MGLYNRLLIDVTCNNCGNQIKGRLQFKVGDLGLCDYIVGDRIQTERDGLELGDKEIVAYGILEDVKCSHCGYVNKDLEYDIFIKDLIVIGFERMINYSPYMKTEGGDYYIK
jgi:hypothetical protein